MSRKARILISGATGFVGANLVRFLVKKNYPIHVLVRKTSNFWRIKDLISKISLWQVDLLEKELLAKTVKKINPRVIFHLANAPLYLGQPSSVKSYIEANLVGTINMIEACQDINYQCFINTGSSAEYGPKEKPMKEDNLCQPRSLYAVTKLAATNYASFVGKIEKKPIITLRLFSPFGPYDDPKRLMVEVIYNALKNKNIFLSRADLVRDYVYIDDVTRAYYLAITAAEKYPGEIFNLGMGRQTTIKKVVETTLDLTSSSSKISWDVFPSRDFESSIWQADLKKTEKCLNWRPEFSLKEGLKKTIDWFKKNLSLYEGRVRTFAA